ncbi:MAG: DUF1565 domain-containing protein [Phycisphaerales bacterium]|nr:DUF1565 domain-containing protein [Phycisphaerales bacterium]
MKLNRIISAGLLLASFATTQAMATNDWYVSTTGNDTAAGSQAAPWRTIQHAINNSSNHDNINVAAGIYLENLVASGHSLQFYGAIGQNPPYVELGVTVTAQTIVQPPAGGSVVSTVGSNNINLTFDNFVFKGGTGTNEGTGNFGGGIYVNDNCSINLYNCLLATNTATDGGGIFVENGSGAGLKMCIIAGCGAPYAPALHNYPPNDASYVILDDVAICGNTGGTPQILGPVTIQGPHHQANVCDHADVDQDGDVDTDDLNALHDELGIELTDVNNNGCVDIDDLLLVIEDWNEGCTP